MPDPFFTKKEVRKRVIKMFQRSQPTLMEKLRQGMKRRRLPKIRRI